MNISAMLARHQLVKVFNPFPMLKTDRLILRALVPDDAQAMYRVMHDPQVLRYFGVLPMQAPVEAEQRIAHVHSSLADGEGIRWAITLREQGQYIGSGGFWRILHSHARAEIGYELAPEVWGQGYATEAIRAMVTFGFERMGLHSVEAQIHPANLGSRRVLEKVGFVQEGHLRENYYDVVEQRYTDTVVFGMLAADQR